MTSETDAEFVERMLFSLHRTHTLLAIGYVSTLSPAVGLRCSGGRSAKRRRMARASLPNRVTQW
jgi:hypothetical protein